MKNACIYLCVTVFSGVLLSACSEPVPQAKYTHPGWDTLYLHGWSIQTPAGFEVRHNMGINPEPGHILSINDSIDIHFDVWDEFVTDYEDCNNDMLTENIESSLEWCEEFYHAGTEHTVWMDTVNGRYAVLSRPIKTGHGTLSIHFTECHHSLAMSISDLTKEEEELVLEMFATIDWKQDGTGN